MKKLGWYAGSVAIVGLFGGGLLLLAANLYVQSRGVQQQILKALASSLQMPAQLTKTTITPWEGLRIDGITLRPEVAPGQPESPDVLKADSFRVRFAFLPLFERRFVVREILLDRPQFTWLQDSRGRWRFPPVKEEPVNTAAAEPTTPPAEAAPSASGPDASPLPPIPPPAPAVADAPKAPKVKRESKPERFSVDVNKFRLRHGVLDFLDEQARSVGRFEEVNLDGRVNGKTAGTGTLAFDKAELPRVGMTLTGFQSRFSFDEVKGFSLQDGKGKIGGGQIYVDYEVRTAEVGSPFNAKCHFEGVSLDQLAPAVAGLLQGKLQGVFTASGLAGDPSSRRGDGHFSVLEGKFKEISILKTLGDALRIEDLARLELKTAQLDCHLEGEQFFIDSLNLAANDLRLTAKGTYDSAEDRVDLQARLIIDQAIGRQLPQFIEGNFTPMGYEAPGSRYLDFSIGGPLSNPASNFVKKALSGPLGSLFQNILAPKPKNPNKKPKKNLLPPQDSPAPEPVVPQP